MKNKLKILGIIAFTVIIGFSIAACDVPDDDKTDTAIKLTVVNNTGFQGHHLYADPSTEPEFSSSKLGATEFLNNGGSKVITIQSAGNYDIRIVTGNTNVYTKYNVNVASSITVTFTEADFESGMLPALIDKWYPVTSSVPDGFPEYSLLLEQDGTGELDSFLDITWRVTGNKLTLKWSDGAGEVIVDEYTFNIANLKLTLSKNGKSAVYYKFDTEWPSNEAWTSFGLPGFQLPAGATIFSVDWSVIFSSVLRDNLRIELSANYAAFENLAAQIEALGLDEYSIDDNDSSYDYVLCAEDYNTFSKLIIYYGSGSMLIDVRKPAAIINSNWTKGSGANLRGITIGASEISFFDGSELAYEIYIDYLDEYGNAALYYYINSDEDYYLDFAVAFDGDTLTISSLEDQDSHEFSRFNGIYTKVIN